MVLDILNPPVISFNHLLRLGYIYRKLAKDPSMTDICGWSCDLPGVPGGTNHPEKTLPDKMKI